MLGNEEVYIESDRTKKEREIQRQIVNIAKTEKAKNRNTEIRISHWKLRVNGTWYRWNEIKGKIEKQNFQVGKQGDTEENGMEVVN